MMINKTCPHCRKQFVRSCNSQKYCSEKCRTAAIEKRKKSIAKCAFCGKKFEITKIRKYCSDECKAKAESRPDCFKRHKPRLSIDEVARLSRKAGMSYGKYVQLYGV